MVYPENILRVSIDITVDDLCDSAQIVLETAVKDQVYMSEEPKLII